MAKRRIQVRVGTAEDMGRRFIDAWHRAERGERVREEHLTFVDFKQLLGTLSDERLRLLKEVRCESAASVRQLAERLGRNYKNVHEDIERLTAAGLLAREDGRVMAPYETILAEMSLAP